MKNNLVKSIIFCLPILLFPIFSYLLDPYKVFSLPRGSFATSWGPNDRIYKTAYLYRIKDQPDRPNAFTFGSSRGYVFETQKVRDIVDKNSRFYNYAFSNESVYDLKNKLEFLANNNYELKHLVILLDQASLAISASQENFLHKDHYLISGENKYKFYGYYLTFLFSGPEEYLYYSLGVSKKYKHTYVVETGDVFHTDQDEILNSDPDYYYNKHQNVFYKRSKEEISSPPAIGEEQKRILLAIREILRLKNADYAIIIPPIYDQKKIAAPDLEFLRANFKNVYDYSGLNKFTSDERNYYDQSHFRTNVALGMLNEIYGKK